VGFHAFTISWEGLRAYAYPLTQSLPRVVAQLRQESADVSLIAPWPMEGMVPDCVGVTAR